MLNYDNWWSKEDDNLTLRKVFDVLEMNNAFLIDIKILNVINNMAINKETVDKKLFDLNTTFGIYSEYSTHLIHQVNFFI